MSTHTRGRPAALVRRLGRALPRGGMLPEDRWRARHQALLALLWVHSAGMVLLALGLGVPLAHAVEEGAILAVPAVLGGAGRLPVRVRSAAVAIGLVASSAVLVHLSGGLIEAHFHFFVVVALLTLYQDWLLFGLAVGFVLLHHGILGTLEPTAVYNHSSAVAHPWRWAAIHGVAVLAAAWAGLLAWRLNEQQALQDGLTGVATGRLLAVRASWVLDRHDAGVVGLAYLDVDGFKSVNDNFGHHAGDELLAEVARRLRKNVRGGDMVARIGGDEFAVLLDGLSGEDQALEIAQRLRSVLAQPYELAGRLVALSASVGVATTRERGARLEQLLADADLAMYAAKAAGSGRVRVFERRMHEAVTERSRLERELAEALDRTEFVLHFQPVVGLRTGRMIGAEALVRWRHPVRGVLAPGEFLPAMQAAGLTPRLTRWVLGEACRWAQARAAAFPDDPPLVLGVNISPRDLVEPGLVQLVGAALAEHGLGAGALCIEVTETALLEDVEGSQGVLAALRGLGVVVALDDFGTGYSSLTHLRHLPLDVVKIDRSFVRGLGVEPADSAVVAAVIELSETLGLSVVAEGVETEGQAALLRDLGCASAQGYLFSRPVPGADLLSGAATASRRG